MPIWTVVAIADGTTRTIEDMGITITANSQITLSEFFDYSDIADSKDLIDFVTLGQITINDGTTNLSPAEGLNYIKRDNIHEDLKTHYTKTELVTPGTGGLVDWSNIANAPSFGSPVWIEPVLYRLTTIVPGPSGTVPVVGAEGDVYYLGNDDNYYKSVGGSWVSQGSPSEGDRVINLGVSPEVVSVYETDEFVDQPESIDNSAVMVNDDGDGKNSQYVYSTETGVWIKIADVDFEDHLDGGGSKHDASEIDVEGTYSNFDNSPGDLETILGDINTQMTEALDNNTLDGAYDEGLLPGDGRVINADSGPVEINSLTSTRAGFRIVPRTNMPSSAPQSGEIVVNGNIMYMYDVGRAMWLSVQRQYLTFGRRNDTRNQYLNLGVGNMPSNNSGFRMIKNGAIVGLSAQVDDNSTCQFQVRSNDQPGVVASIDLSNELGAVNNSLGVAFDQDDYLQAYLSSSSNVPDPVMIVEIAYTLT